MAHRRNQVGMINYWTGILQAYMNKAKKGNEKPQADKGDRTMEAEDMFEDGTLQIFSVRTGERLGYYRPGGEMPAEEPEPQQQQEVKNPNQLSIF